MIAPAMIHNAAPAAAAYTELFFLRMEGSITEPMHRTDSAINIGDLNTSQTVPAGGRLAQTDQVAFGKQHDPLAVLASIHNNSNASKGRKNSGTCN